MPRKRAAQRAPRKRNRKGRLLKSLVPNKVHSFSRSKTEVLGLVDDATQVMSYANVLSKGYVSLDSLPNSTEFTTLFDSYRIVKVKQVFMYTATSSEQPDAVASETLVGHMIPYMYSILDYDDGTPVSFPAGATKYDEYDQYPNGKTRRLDRVFTRTFKPRCTESIYAGAVSTAYGLAPSKTWIDCSRADVQYYGHKWAIDKHTAGGTNDPLGYLYIKTTVWLQFKGIR